MTAFYGIKKRTAKFLFGTRVKEFDSVTYKGRTAEDPRRSGLFKSVYEVTRHGEMGMVDGPDGGGYVDYMREGTAFDIVITDHARYDCELPYSVELVRREVRVGKVDDCKLVVTVDFDAEDASPPTMHREAIRAVIDLFPPRETGAHSDVPVTS